MVQQDYILRMIQQYVAAIHRIAGLRTAGDEVQAEVAVRDAYGRFVGLNPSLVHVLSEDDLVELLKARGALDPHRVLALAALLREEGDLHDGRGEPAEAIPRYLKALRLTLEVLPDLEDGPPPSGLISVDGLLARLGDVDLPRPSAELLATHFEAGGRFARAEDARHALLQADPTDDRARDDLRAFYRRLLARPDAELASGGLTREEIEESVSLLDDGMAES